MAYGTYGRDTLIDAAPGGLGAYEFPVNHSDEDEFGSGRQVTATPNTSGTGAVLQQGAEELPVITLRGVVLHKTQHETMIDFTQISKERTVIFRNYFGEEFEVVIASYRHTPKRTLRNPRDSTMANHYYAYTMQLQVIRVIAGAWA